tara:strand:+ start:979 stop:1449 length:471 start_codon:yes stop_codon:yes gene_type:complete
MELKELSKKSKPYKVYSMGEFQKKHNIRQFALQYALENGKVDYTKVGNYHIVVGTKLTENYEPVYYTGSARCKGKDPEGKHGTNKDKKGRFIPLEELFKYPLIRRAKWIEDSKGHIQSGNAQYALDKHHVDFIKIGRERLIILSDKTKDYRVKKQK